MHMETRKELLLIQVMEMKTRKDALTVITGIHILRKEAILKANDREGKERSRMQEE